MRRLLLALLFVLPAVASAEILVRDCPNNVCVWTLPANATRVQVNRSGTPIVPLAEVLPTERIVTCYHDPDLVPGSSGSCDTRVPGRSDVWELKSVLYPTTQPAPTGEGHITVVWDAVSTDTAGAPYAGTTGYRVNRQLDVCTVLPADSRCGTMPWIVQDVGNVTRHVFQLPAGRWCFTVQGYDASGNGGAVTPPDPLLCAIPSQPVAPLPAAPTNARAISGNLPQ
jgi:hypothetical protein